VPRGTFVGETHLTFNFQSHFFVGRTMTLRTFLTLVVLASALSMGSCSGVKSGTGGGGGTAKVFVTFTATPLTPPAGTNLLSFSVTVAGISLTASGGGTPVNISLNNSTYSVDLTRLQSDSAFVAAATSVAAGTYSSMTVSLASPLVTYCTQTTGGIGCTPGTVKTVTTGAAAAPQLTTTPFPITLSNNQSEGIAININLQNALTISPTLPQVVTAVNLSATNVVTASTLPPAASSLPMGPLSFIEDVTGVVTAVSPGAQSVTVKTAIRGSFTAIANSFTVFSPNCTTFNLSLTFASCVVEGHVASLDLELNTDGTFTVLEYDPLATTTGDWIEGIITSPPTSTTQFQIVLNDFTLSTTNSLIGTGLVLGDPVNVTLASPQPFAVDNKGLIVPAARFAGNTDTSVLQPGQTVAVHLSAFTAGSGSTFAAATVNFLYLRFTRVTGTVESANPPNTFNVQSLPPFFGVTVPLIVQLTDASPSTNFDGISSASGLAASQTVSISALYFGPPTGPTPTPTQFSATKVRVP
jgi:hypothetical protein